MKKTKSENVDDLFKHVIAYYIEQGTPSGSVWFTAPGNTFHVIMDAFETL